MQNEHDIELNELIKKAIIESITDSLRYKFQNTVDKLNGMQKKKYDDLEAPHRFGKPNKDVESRKD